MSHSNHQRLMEQFFRANNINFISSSKWDTLSVCFNSRNLINEIINIAGIQFIELDGITGKNFGLLIIDELSRK